MAILNCTPDSFYDGGKFTTEKSILLQVEKQLIEGADIIDIGAYSSRPNAKHISVDEESDRLLPVVRAISKAFPNAVISVDTFRSSIAKKAVDVGAHIINDISGGNLDHHMFQTIAELKVPYVLMHMQGTPQTMQNKPITTAVTRHVNSFFQKKVQDLALLGVNNVILDVGFGFGKTLDQNYELLKNLASFKHFNKPLLVGLSRKSMLYKLLDSTPNNVLNATTIANTIASLNGADILRVHDIKEAVEVVKVIKQYQNN
ncbi:MAG TPA: dihydropteroate synthase [Saprospiraceae bacterium]|nr:dihydropteroate synthase [Saprospiraceae bacterium]